MTNPIVTSVKINGYEYPTHYEDKETGYFETIEYDEKGRIISFTNPEGTETWEYLSKKWDLYTKHTFSNGTWEKWTYDEAEDWRTLPPILTSYYNSMGVMTTIKSCRVDETSNDRLFIVNDNFPNLMNYGVVKGDLYLKSTTKKGRNNGCPDFREPLKTYPKSKLLKTNGCRSVQQRSYIMESIETVGESVIRKGSRRHTYNVRIGIKRVVVELTDKSVNENAKYIYWTQWVFDKEMNLLKKVEEKRVDPTFEPNRLIKEDEKTKVKRKTPLKSASPTVLYFDEYDRDDYGIPASVYSACKEYEDLATIVNYDYD